MAKRDQWFHFNGSAPGKSRGGEQEGNLLFLKCRVSAFPAGIMPFFCVQAGDGMIGYGV